MHREHSFLSSRSNLVGLWGCSRPLQVEPSWSSLTGGACLSSHFPSHFFLFSFQTLLRWPMLTCRKKVLCFATASTQRALYLLPWPKCKILAKPDGWAPLSYHRAIAFVLPLMRAEWKRSGKGLGGEARVKSKESGNEPSCSTVAAAL